MTTRIWTQEKIDRAKYLREQEHWTYEKIDLELGIRVGATADKFKKMGMTSEEKAAYNRRRHINEQRLLAPKIWDDAKIARAKALLAEGYQMIEIDAAFGLKPNSTSWKFSELRRSGDGPPLRGGGRGRIKYDQSHGPYVSQELFDERDERAQAMRSITSMICGDPPPGWSALDRRK